LLYILFGADDFSERLVGTLTGIDLPVVGQTLRQGEAFARLHHGNRVLTQMTCTIGKDEVQNS
jgi:hypothetical protein